MTLQDAVSIHGALVGLLNIYCCLISTSISGKYVVLLLSEKLGIWSCCSPLLLHVLLFLLALDLLQPPTRVVSAPLEPTTLMFANSSYASKPQSWLCIEKPTDIRSQKLS